MAKKATAHLSSDVEWPSHFLSGARPAGRYSLAGMTLDTVAVRLLVALLVAASSGCATIIKGTGRDVVFTSTPAGASIYVQGKFVGRTPVIAKVDHGRDKVVVARMPGYEPRQATLTTHFSGHSLWLYPFALIDLITGAMFTVDEGSLHLDLMPTAQMAQAADRRYAPSGDPRYAAPGDPRYGPSGDPRYAPQTVRSPPAPVRQSMVSAAAQRGNKRLAVLEFQGRNLDQDILMTFSDTVRGGALQGLEGRGVVVMTRENMLVLLRDMGKKECSEGECEVETARNLGADYVVSGKVVRMEQIYVVTLKLHETVGGSLIGTDTVEAASQIDLLRSLRERARKLLTAAFSPGTGPR
jgi:TolB-like protein